MERQTRNYGPSRRRGRDKPQGDIFGAIALWLKTTYKDKRSVSATAASFLLGLAPMTIGFNPFGAAFFFASMLPTLPMAIGLFFSSAASGLTAPMPMLCATVGALIKIWLAKKGKLTVAVRITLSSAAGLVGGLFRIAFVSGDVGEPFRTILLALAVPFFCVLFLGLDKKTATFGTTHEILARLALLFCGARLLSVVTVGWFSLGVAASAGATLYITYMYCKYESSRPSPSCCIAGCVVGFCLGLGTGDIGAVPMLGIFGLTAGFLYPLHELTAIICAPIGAILFSSAAVDTVAGLIAFIHITLGFGFYVALRRLPAGELVKMMFVHEKKQTAPQGDKNLTLVEESFSSLSQALRTLSEFDAKERNTVTELPLCCADCNGCFSHGINEFELRQGMQDYLAVGTDIPEYMLQSCPNSAAVRSSLEVMRSADGDVIAATAQRYEEFSRILSSVRETAEREDAVDVALSLRLSEALTKMGLSFSHARVFGTRKLRAEVYDVHLNEMECSSNTLKSAVSTALERQVSDPFFLVNDDCVSIRFETVPLCRVEHSKMTAAKQGEVTNGDTVAAFESTSGMFYGLINDGMGSGELAAVCSRMGAILIEKLVLLGSDKDEVLRLLNKILLTKGDEVFTTVDLLSLDRLTMEAELTKAGAAATYLVRGSDITALTAQSAPLGLVDTLTAKRLRIKLQHGDIVVMMSDGAHDGDTAPEWMREYFNANKSVSTAVMTATLMELARSNAANPDDVSVLVTRVVNMSPLQY